MRLRGCFLILIRCQFPAHWLEDDVSRAITIRSFQFMANHALFGQRQALFGNDRPGDVAAQPFQLVAQGTFSIATRSHLVTLIGFGRHTGVQGDKIAGSDFEQLKAGPKGGGQDARSNPATIPATGVSSASRSSGRVCKVRKQEQKPVIAT